MLGKIQDQGCINSINRTKQFSTFLVISTKILKRVVLPSAGHVLFMTGNDDDDDDDYDDDDDDDDVLNFGHLCQIKIFEIENTFKGIFHG